MTRAIPLLLVSLLSAFLGWQLYPREGKQVSFPRVTAPPAGGDFTLSMPSGSFSLSELEGKVVLLYFGYSWCPDVCPTALGMMGAALRQLSDVQRQQVVGLFVSIDPERDKGAKLVDYSHYFHPQIRGVTGTSEEIRAVTRQYGAHYQIAVADENGDYVVNHSSTTYLIDQQGRLREQLPHATSPKAIIDAVEHYL